MREIGRQVDRYTGTTGRPVYLPTCLPVYLVYILECADGTLYTGWTTDLGRRVTAHNSGRGARYTRGRRPVRLVYWETCTSQRVAQQREAALRRLPRPAKLALIAEMEEAASGSAGRRLDEQNT